MSKSFKNRVFGCAIIKSINSNYNADFSHQPRTLPNGIVYATDKALKYTVKNFIVNIYSDLTKSQSDLEKEEKESVFYFQRARFVDGDIKVHSMASNYEFLFGKKAEKGKKIEIQNQLYKCIDIRLFGATFTGDANVSVHGPVQITHGVNRFAENVIYTETIKPPQNPDETADMTTLGTQSKLQEGHYVHHFSVNPQNIGKDVLKVSDIEKLKEGLYKGATYYDSASKAGTENELLLWVQLKENSKIVLPSFVELVTVNENKEIDLSQIQTLLAKEHIKSEIEKIELYYSKGITKVIDSPEGAVEHEL